jgi:hypothetical protein
MNDETPTTTESDEDFAAELVGTHVLVGVTEVDHAGTVLRQRQFHGRVLRASATEGVILLDPEGREHWVPLHRDAYEPAEPGEYRLRSTGEVVVDPTWLTTWTVHPRDRH